MNRFDYEIEHYGIKGMKWGVRRALGSTGHVIGSKYAKTESKTKRPDNSSDGAVSKSSKGSGKTSKTADSQADEIIKSKGKNKTSEEIGKVADQYRLEGSVKLISKYPEAIVGKAVKERARKAVTDPNSTSNEELRSIESDYGKAMSKIKNDKQLIKAMKKSGMSDNDITATKDELLSLNREYSTKLNTLESLYQQVEEQENVKRLTRNGR